LSGIQLCIVLLVLLSEGLLLQQLLLELSGGHGHCRVRHGRHRRRAILLHGRDLLHKLLLLLLLLQLGKQSGQEQRLRVRARAARLGSVLHEQIQQRRRVRGRGAPSP